PYPREFFASLAADEVNETLAGQALISLDIPQASRCHNVFWQHWWRSFRSYIPPRFLGGQPVAHVLLIKTGLYYAFGICVCWPIAGGIRGEYFIAQDQISLSIKTKLKLRIRQDDAFFFSNLGCL